MKRFFIDKKNIVILFLGILVAIRIPHEGIRFLWWIWTGVLVSVGSDLLINRFFFKKDIIPKSAIITGFIASGIIDYNGPWFLVCIFPLLAIISKHVIRYKKRHIFNPANLSLFVAVLFKIPLTWHIEANIYLIIIFGLYIIYSIKKIPHVLGFLISFTVLFMTQGIVPFALLSWFFIFIMLIEPKTSGFGLWRGFMFGAIAGTTSFLVFRFFPSYDLFVASLFVANLSNPILEKIKR
jgi:hypothetical protein